MNSQSAVSREHGATPTGGTVTLLFTDFVGSTKLFDRLGDDAANDVRRTYFRLLRAALAPYEGREIKTLGDGFMVAFQSSVTALGCAVAMQEACERHREEERGGQGLGLRIGVNAGEVIHEEDDYFGTAVVVARRLCDHAEGAQVLVSELVRGLVGSRGDHAFRDLGLLTLKGLADPVRGYELLWNIPTAALRQAAPQQTRPALEAERQVSATGPAAVRIRLCTPLAIEIGGQRVDEALPGRQGRLLFAYLVANRRRPVTRDSVIDVLWPERPARDPDSALSVLLSKLRRVLGPELLPARGEMQLKLPGDAWIDIEAAEATVTDALEALGRGDRRAARAAAREALELLEGEFLPGAESRWAVDRRQTLDDLRRDALECLAEAALALGGPGRQEAERTARQLIEQSPFHESGYRLLMEALAAQGDIAEALLVFDRLRTLLREELGATPGSALTTLHERLLKGERAEPAAAAEGALAAGAGELAIPWIFAGDELFVGRGPELEHLRELWKGARAGKPGLALIAGEPGVGKTRLAAELARSLPAEGGLVLYGHCDEEPLLPYQPFVEALGQYVARTPAAELRGRLGEEGPELTRLLPELGRRLPDLPEPASADSGAERYRLLEAVSHVLTDISEAAPLLLVLDDLHWADKPTLVMLRHVVRRAERARLLMLATYRETELDENHPLSGLLADLCRGRIDPFVLEGLTKPDVEALVAARAGEQAMEELAHAIHDETAGNPLFVEEMLRHLLKPGATQDYKGSLALAFERRGIPKTVEEVIARRLSHLPEEARAVLSAASIVGREFDIKVLKRVCGLPPASILEALEEAAAARLISEIPGTAARYRFSHALVRETLRARLPVGRRLELHLRVGEALERIFAGSAEPHAADLAYHFLEGALAGDVDKAVRYATRAADEATDKLAYEESARQLVLALKTLELKEVQDESQRCALLLKLGEARWSAGEFEGSRDSFRRAAQVAEALRAPEQLARAALGFGGQYVAFQAGVVDEVLIDLLERALEALAEGDGALRARVMARLAEGLTFSAEQERKASLAREAAAMGRRVGDRAALGDVLNRIEWASRSPENLEERLAVTQEIVGLGEELGDATLAAAGHDARISHLLEAGDIDAAIREFEAFEQRAKALRQPYLRWLVAVHRAGRALLEGRLEEVEELALRALAAGQEAQNTNAAQLFGVQILFLRREQGRLAELVDAVKGFAEQYPALPAWRCVLAWVYTELGREDEGRRELERLAQNDFSDLPRDTFWLISAWLLSEVVVALGDRRRAGLLYELLLPYARRCALTPPVSICTGSLSRSLGRLATGLSRFDEGSRHFEHALDLHARLGARPWLAHTQHEYARLLVARGEPADLDRARELLAQALVTARELGMTALAQRASAQTPQARAAAP